MNGALRSYCCYLEPSFELFVPPALRSITTMLKGLLIHFLLMDETSQRQVTWGSLCKPHFENEVP